MWQANISIFHKHSNWFKVVTERVRFIFRNVLRFNNNYYNNVNLLNFIYWNDSPIKF